MKPHVSVIVPNFNKRNYLEATLRSAAEQEGVGEIICVDDASTDGSREVILGLAHELPLLRVVCETHNSGGSACRNKGLRLAQHEYIIFLDSDDLLAPHCIQQRLAFAHRHPEYDLWVFPMQTFRNTTDEKGVLWMPREGDHLSHFLAHRLDWSISQPLWRRSLLDAMGGFDESFSRLQDVELHARALLAGGRVKCASDMQPDCFYRVIADRHAGNVPDLSHRHLDSAIHFYETFFSRVPLDKRPSLTGTLFMCLAQHDHWRRAGTLSAADYASASARLIAACRFASHRFILSAYTELQKRLQFHIPGIRWVTRGMLGI